MVPWAMRPRGWERDCCLNEETTVNEIFQVGKIAFNDGTYNLQASATKESRIEQSVGSHIQTIKNKSQGTSLVVQWVRLGASTTGGTSSIPGQGTKIPHAMWQGQKKKIKIRARSASKENHNIECYLPLHLSYETQKTQVKN